MGCLVVLLFVLAAGVAYAIGGFWLVPAAWIVLGGAVACWEGTQ